MATSLLALLDDITSVLDDVATMAQLAAKKTAGVLGDDLALNAQQVAGVNADRELPVVWAVARGSLLNKAVLVPAALAISAWAPWWVTPLLMVGGAYLCFEGFEKLAHKYLAGSAQDAAHHDALVQALADPKVDIVQLEKDKIKGAVRTDFILSGEIVVITLGTVAQAPLMQQFTVLASIALLMTVGVYGAVAAIVKLDDLGLWLSRRPGWPAVQALGRALVSAAPWLMRVLAVVGTAAMFLVGGGILSHGVPLLHHVVESLSAGAGAALGAVGVALVPLLADGLVGLLAGALVLGMVTLVQRWRAPSAA